VVVFQWLQPEDDSPGDNVRQRSKRGIHANENEFGEQGGGLGWLNS